MVKKRIHIFASGRVQGVYYRQNMIKIASELEVTGWVKNRTDGRVEAVIEGDAASVDTLVEWSKKGPVFARVKQLEKIEEEYTGEFEKFRVKHD